MKTRRIISLIALLLLTNIITTFAQLPPLPGDPGVNVPLDGGLLLGLLAGAGFVVSLFKKNKKAKV